MAILVTFNCDGCSRFKAGKKTISRRFVSITGRGHGFGHWEVDSVASVAPNDWIAFDPLTGCCNCPECWAEIVNEEVEETA